MQPVSKEKFYATVGPLNVHPRIVNSSHPYTSIWELQNGSRKVIGKSVDRMEGGRSLTDYFLENAK